MFPVSDITINLLLDVRGSPPDPSPTVEMEAVADRPLLLPGEMASVTLTIYNRGREPIHFQHNLGDALNGGTIPPDSSRRWTEGYRAGEITQPWWLVRPRTGDLFNAKLDGIPEDQR